MQKLEVTSYLIGDDKIHIEGSLNGNKTFWDFDKQIMKDYATAAGLRKWVIQVVVNGNIGSQQGLMSWGEYFDWLQKEDVAEFVSVSLKNVRRSNAKKAHCDNS